MIFDEVNLPQARGGILAHNLQTGGRVIRKGALVDQDVMAALAAAGFERITIARLEPGDVPEGEAARRLGAALCSAYVSCSDDVHGRVNLLATVPGLLKINVPAIERLNFIDEAITIATLADLSNVAAGDMLATIKIIPFAVAGETLRLAEAIIAQSPDLLVIKPYRPLRAALILSTLPQLKDAAIEHTIEATRGRIESRSGSLLAPQIVPHETKALAAAITQALQDGAELVLVSGASAVTDRLDVAPAAIVAAGGVVTRFGMPVDPGNLICFGQIGAVQAIILPGCARSEKLNGIDWVLDRIFAGEPTDDAAIARMGVGGLLKEFPARPVPRAATSRGTGRAPRAKPRVAAIVLAAGLSRRMAPDNKLLLRLHDGRTMIEATIDHVLASHARPVFVVTGHDDAAVKSVIGKRRVSFVHADDYAQGMAASLRAGLAALPDDIGAALICLGDMPLVEPAILNRIIAAYDPDEGRSIAIPVHHGTRGNPRLWDRRYFPDMMSLQGDEGAKQILHTHMDQVVDVEISTPEVLQDLDDPAAIKAQGLFS
ncbi:MAG: 4-diphosphocytidyl-2C-methyl-D-erythritol kinase [Rhodospirillales bacterium 20-60-12]|nr:MAG: 4-diphosphocytidyl-2C-methyl-D-erythritol kinase [Rhodospirillales bacterium 20-60-12]HQT67597.1 molybdopterin-binding/glycosyltransferase family 2 protein [Acetobacteraceae bacterium]